MFSTFHRVFFQDSQNLGQVSSDTVDLVITSPPYPMIEMWDGIFASQDKRISDALGQNDGSRAFELMHCILDSVWKETFRVLKKGGFVCINIGDATRTLNGDFALYPNHARIVSCMMKLGFTPLPDIIWRKQTNAPNKFMGSGMLPAGAYVTFEHEYILIFRKGGKREFTGEMEKQLRRESAYFWEERNIFFSDVWFDVKGTGQTIKKSDTRSRSAAFPFELVYRLIAMYSVKGDTVLDPFMGTGTTMLAAMASARNSIGFEIDENLREVIHGCCEGIVDFSNIYINNRLERHAAFADERIKSGKEMKHSSSFYGFPVVTNQERNIFLNELKNVSISGKDEYLVSYSDADSDKSLSAQDSREAAKTGIKKKSGSTGNGGGQMSLW